MTRTEPNDLEACSSSRSDVTTFRPARSGSAASRSGDRIERSRRPARRQRACCSRRPSSYGKSVPFFHWPPDELRLGDVRERLPGPLDRPDDRVQVRGGDRRDDGVGREVRRALQDVDGDLDQRVGEADRLRPLLARRRRVRVGELLRRLIRQRRAEWVRRTPPVLGGHPFADARRAPRRTTGTGAPCPPTRSSARSPAGSPASRSS